MDCCSACRFDASIVKCYNWAQAVSISLPATAAMLFDPQQLTRCANFLGLPLLPVAGQEQATAPADGVARIGLLGASQVRGGGGETCACTGRCKLSGCTVAACPACCSLIAP